MRPHRRVLVAVTSVLTAVSPIPLGPLGPLARLAPLTIVPVASAGSGSAGADLAFVETVVHRLSLREFAFVASHGDPWFDWSTDLCSAPLVGSTGRSFDFRLPCRRHDFAYRNLRLLEHRYGSGATFWNPTSRRRADDRFHTDMDAHCAARTWHERTTCRWWADVFHTAVRGAGGP